VEAGLHFHKDDESPDFEVKLVRNRAGACSKVRILVAEDDRDTAQFIRCGLRELGHKILLTADGSEALHLLSTEQLDVAILDRMLPGLDGLSIVRRVRAAGIEVPVLLLTALGRIEDRVSGLEAGGDDYLVKPFAFSELAARVNALTRRTPLQQEHTRLEHDGLVLDLLKRQVVRDGIVVRLQPREFRILEELMREEGKVVTRTMLLERVWKYHFDPQTNIVDTHISRLRSKLNEGGRPDLIETIRGVGYRMASNA
jgi:two-component system, OmpR family, response regulator